MKTIVMADLPAAQQKAFFEFLAANQVEFEGEVDGSYVATVRVCAEDKFTKDLTTGQKAANEKKAAWVPSDEEAQTIARLQIRFPTLTTCLKPPNGTLKDIRAGQLEKLVEEFYDVQFQRDFHKAEGELLKGVEFQFGKSLGELVYQFMAKKYGITSVMNQLMWNVLYAVDKHEQDNVMMHSFGSFLCGTYTQADLLFYCFARSLLKRDKKVQSAPLTLQQCERKIEIFERQFKLGTELIDWIKTMLADNLKVDMWTFLALAVQAYHDSRCQNQARKSSPNLLIRELNRSTDPDSPALSDGAISPRTLRGAVPNFHMNSPHAHQSSHVFSTSASRPVNTFEQSDKPEGQLPTRDQSPGHETRASAQIRTSASPSVRDTSPVSSRHGARSPAVFSSCSVRSTHSLRPARDPGSTVQHSNAARTRRALEAQPTATTFPYGAREEGVHNPYACARVGMTRSATAVSSRSSSPLHDRSARARGAGASTKRMGHGARGKAAPEKAAPEKAAPEKAAPEKAAPEKAAPGKAAPGKAAPGKAAPKKKLARSMSMPIKQIGEGTEGLETQKNSAGDEAQGPGPQPTTTPRVFVSKETRSRNRLSPEELYGEEMTHTDDAESACLYANVGKAHKDVPHTYPRRRRSMRHAARGATFPPTPERATRHQELLSQNARNHSGHYASTLPMARAPEYHTTFSDDKFSIRTSFRSSRSLSQRSLADATARMRISSIDGNTSFVSSSLLSGVPRGGSKPHRSHAFMRKAGVHATQHLREDCCISGSAPPQNTAIHGVATRNPGEKACTHPGVSTPRKDTARLDVAKSVSREARVLTPPDVRKPPKDTAVRDVATRNPVEKAWTPPGVRLPPKNTAIRGVATSIPRDKTSTPPGVRSPPKDTVTRDVAKRTPREKALAQQNRTFASPAARTKVNTHHSEPRRVLTLMDAAAHKPRSGSQPHTTGLHERRKRPIQSSSASAPRKVLASGSDDARPHQGKARKSSTSLPRVPHTGTPPSHRQRGTHIYRTLQDSTRYDVATRTPGDPADTQSRSRSVPVDTAEPRLMHQVFREGERRSQSSDSSGVSENWAGTPLSQRVGSTRSMHQARIQPWNSSTQSPSTRLSPLITAREAR